MSALELSEWVAWLDAEQVGPWWDRLRHAELMAAVANGSLTKRSGLFSAADFLPADPWLPPPKPLTAEQTRARLQAELAGMEDLFG